MSGGPASIQSASEVIGGRLRARHWQMASRVEVKEPPALWESWWRDEPDKIFSMLGIYWHGAPGAPLVKVTTPYAVAADRLRELAECFDPDPGPIFTNEEVETKGDGYLLRPASDTPELEGNDA
mgnify:FL=1